ncbi:hypothetical protein HRbin28_01307 [bacterium HR28]|nr:hypothetical protein HRbin28_01307 [bacterium HR28]
MNIATAPMNRVLLVSTLGNRDVTVDGQLIPQDDFRTACEALLAELEHDRSAVLTRLGAPILERIVTWILDRHADPDYRPQLRIYLIASDQEDKRFRHTDTIPAARLLQAWLPHVFDNGSIERVSLWRIDTNPADYDDAVRFYRLLIGQRALPDPREFAAIYLNPTGGTPALSFGLLTVLAPFFGERTVVIYMPARTLRPTPLDVGATYRQFQALDDAMRAIERYDFAHAAHLLRVAMAPLPLYAFAEVLAYRLAFDFRRALQRLEGTVIPASRGTLRQLARREQDTLHRLLSDAETLEQAREPVPDRYPALLAELYGSASIAWEQERYADFLARVFRFEEALLRWAVEHCLRLPTGVDRDDRGRPRSLPAFQAGIAGDPDLAQHVAASPFDPTRPPTRDLLRHLLSLPRLADDPVARTVRESSLALDSLSQLRNRSIVAHGFAPVSREEIEARCPNPLEILGRLVTATGYDATVHPLAMSQQGLCAELRRL